MKTYKVLILEDEVLIADTIERYLIQQGYQVIGKAISVAEGKKLFQAHSCDIVLIDIRLSGPESGIEFAQFINKQKHPVPFIFLTSQTDPESIDKAKATYPSGYLSKPLQKESLFATIEIAMHTHQSPADREDHIQMTDGITNYLVKISDILFLQADHIYIKVYLADGKILMQRSSLNHFLKILPVDRFVQTHRSYVVNIHQISRWDTTQLFIGQHCIPISRSRRKQIFQQISQA